MTGWLVLSALTNIIQVLYIIQLVNQRHELDQEVAGYRWAAMNKLKDK